MPPAGNFDANDANTVERTVAVHPNPPSGVMHVRRLMYKCGMRTHNLSDLVRCNPMVAIQCLLLLILPYIAVGNGRDYGGVQEMEWNELDKNEYLSALIGMDMSLHSMDVVNRLATYPIDGTNGGGDHDGGGTIWSYLHL